VIESLKPSIKEKHCNSSLLRTKNIRLMIKNNKEYDFDKLGFYWNYFEFLFETVNVLYTRMIMKLTQYIIVIIKSFCCQPVNLEGKRVNSFLFISEKFVALIHKRKMIHYYD